MDALDPGTRAALLGLQSGPSREMQERMEQLIEEKIKRTGDLTLAQLCVNTLGIGHEYPARADVDALAGGMLLKLLRRSKPEDL